jgi:hypothetical protein
MALIFSVGKYPKQIGIVFCTCLALFTIRLCKWKPYVPPKHRAFTELHGVATPKIVLLVGTTVRTSNSKEMYNFLYSNLDKNTASEHNLSKIK